MTPKKRVVYDGMIIVVTALVLFFLNMAYTNYVDQKSQRNLCGLITATDDAYTAQPPKTDSGKHVAFEIHAYLLRVCRK
jgi:hypothetical protein